MMLRCEALGMVVIHELLPPNAVADTGDGRAMIGASSGTATAVGEAEIA
jgi:hypothetical protein